MKDRMISIVLVAVFLMAATNAFSNGQQEDKTVVLKIATGINEAHPTFQGCVKFGELIEAKLPVDVQMYGNAQLGDDVKVTEQVSMGILEMCTTSSSPIVGLAPKFQVLDLPFLFQSAESSDKVLDGEIGKELSNSLKDKGIIVIAYFDGGFRQLTNSKRSVVIPADLDGLKIRTMENEIHLAAWKALGAKPTPMPFSEVFTAMQQKTIDGQENPVSIISSQKFYEVQDYMTLTSHVWQPHMLLMSKAVFDNFSKEDQKIILDAGMEATLYQRKLTRDLNDEYIAELEKSGMTVTRLTPEQHRLFQQKVQPVYAQYEDKIGKDFIEQVKSVANGN